MQKDICPDNIDNSSSYYDKTCSVLQIHNAAPVVPGLLYDTCPVDFDDISKNKFRDNIVMIRALCVIQ